MLAAYAPVYFGAVLREAVGDLHKCKLQWRFPMYMIGILKGRSSETSPCHRCMCMLAWEMEPARVQSLTTECCVATPNLYNKKVCHWLSTWQFLIYFQFCCDLERKVNCNLCVFFYRPRTKIHIRLAKWEYSKLQRTVWMFRLGFKVGLEFRLGSGLGSRG